MVRVYINSGHLSADNGAKFPLTYLVDLAKALFIDINWGVHYYDDSLDVEEDLLPTVIELLEENNMLYKVVGQHSVWQNVKTESVAKRLNVRLAA